jgi:cytochrome c biogenesis protein CcdA/glutathione peroxidase-family protein
MPFNQEKHMQTDLVSIGLGFLEGFALIISPCILPILPIILAGSIDGSKKRPLGIITGFILTFAIFTFFSRQVVIYSGIDLNILRHVSFVILLLLGIIMLSSYLTEKFALFTRKLTSAGSSLSTANNTQGGFFSGLLFGGLIAIIWTPCAGPILAAVIVQTVTQQNNVISFLTLVAFAVGASVPMLIIALFGRGIMSKLSFLKTHTTLLRKALGLIVIASVVYMFYAESAPTTTQATVTTSDKAAISLQHPLETPYAAPDLIGIDAWINSSPIELKHLKGKVVLIDFWTYSCINCVRTLPYLKAWSEKYKDDGLVIIGVHTPEFDFEKKLANVQNAVTQYGLTYPVALDSTFKTWQNFKNQYWPAHYLIDQTGKVVYTHFGEGSYDVTENNIRFLLGKKTASTSQPSIVAQSTAAVTPETYLGYNRAANFANGIAVKNKVNDYQFKATLNDNQWALNGDWEIKADRIVSAGKDSRLTLHFQASKVFVVMDNSTGKPIKVNLKLNNLDVDKHQGRDVTASEITVNENSLYQVLVFDQSNNGQLTLSTTTPGLELYTFTFER